MYIAPSGQKFRSIKQAQSHVADSLVKEQRAPAGNEGGRGGAGGKARAKTAAGSSAASTRVPREPKVRSEAELAKAEAAREAKKAAEHARLQALNADSNNAICFECNSGDEITGNEILLCDGPGCFAAYHLRCLRRPLFAVPEGDWLCPACEDLKPIPPPSMMFSPTVPAMQLEPSRQAVDGCDIMRFAKTQCADAPTRCASSRGVPSPLALSDVCGKACLFSAEPGGVLRAGVVLDLRPADPTRPVPQTSPAPSESPASALCANLALSGRKSSCWVALAPPPPASTAPAPAPGATPAAAFGDGDGIGEPAAGCMPSSGLCSPSSPAAHLAGQVAPSNSPGSAVARKNATTPSLYVGGEVCMVPRTLEGASASTGGAASSCVMWPARLFHLLSARAVESSATTHGGSSAASSGSSPRSSSHSGPAPAELAVPLRDEETVLARLFGEGLSEEQALVRVPRSEIRPFARTLLSPLNEGMSELALVQAKVDCLNWTLRHPAHARGIEPPPSLPPPKTMQLLVGQAVEVLWLADGAQQEAGWYKALVESYDETTGLHFLVYADGDVEWLALHSGFFAWHLLDETQHSELRSHITIARQLQLRSSLPGRPLAMTATGDRLYGPPTQCAHCNAPSTRPGGLLECSRCAKSYHASCLHEPHHREEAEKAARDGRWVCDQCGQCDGCGVRRPSELRSHWPSKHASELQGPWRQDAGRRLLCVSCSGSVKCAARCASTLEVWRTGQRKGLLCTKCNLWSSPASKQGGGGGGSSAPRLTSPKGGGEPGKLMPPPPPPSVGGVNFHVAPSLRIPSCRRCESASLYWSLKDALDELQGIDPLRYFAEPVDEDLEPTYRTVIPDPMDFSTMRTKLQRGEYTEYSELADDFALLCRNAIVFNTQLNNPFRRAAQQLHARGTEILKELFEADHVHVPSAAELAAAEKAEAEAAAKAKEEADGGGGGGGGGQGGGRG